MASRLQPISRPGMNPPIRPASVAVRRDAVLAEGDTTHRRYRSSHPDGDISANRNQWSYERLEDGAGAVVLVWQLRPRVGRAQVRRPGSGRCTGGGSGPGPDWPRVRPGPAR